MFIHFAFCVSLSSGHIMQLATFLSLLMFFVFNLSSFLLFFYLFSLLFFVMISFICNSNFSHSFYSRFSNELRAFSALFSSKHKCVLILCKASLAYVFKSRSQKTCDPESLTSAMLNPNVNQSYWPFTKKNTQTVFYLNSCMFYTKLRRSIFVKSLFRLFCYLM